LQIKYDLTFLFFKEKAIRQIFHRAACVFCKPLFLLFAFSSTQPSTVAQWVKIKVKATNVYFQI